MAIRLEENVPEKERGSLYGIPISVKECFYVGGYDATVGLIKHLNNPAIEDGGFVKVLIRNQCSVMFVSSTNFCAVKETDQFK